VSLLKRVLGKGASFQELKEPLAYTDEWHMEGVRRADLLFLVGSEDEGLRDTGRRLMGVVKVACAGGEIRRQQPEGRPR
jgi:hypothetical protein